MSAATNGAAALKNFADQFKYILDLSDALEKIGSMDNYAAESKAAADKAVSERDKVQAELADARENLSATKEKSGQLMVDADSYVAESQAKADAEAAQVVADARLYADGINADAQVLAQKLVGDAGAQVSILQGQEQEIRATIEELTNVLVQVTAETDAATAKLQSIKESIAKIAAA